MVLFTIALYGAAVTPASAQPGPPTPLGVDAPHIALLLPVDSSVLRRHAEAVRDGFLAAAKSQNQPSLLIRVYAVGDEPKIAVASYQQAVKTGARLVIGPLVRPAVSAIAATKDIAIPTLALNVPENAVTLPPNFYVLSLQIEAEARQVARTAWRDGRRNAYTMASGGPLNRRLQQAFAAEFSRLGGKHVAEFQYSTSPAELERFKQAAELRVADMIFLALDAREAGRVRGHLDPLALYASSTVYTGDTGATPGLDLAGIRFVDMPWLLQRDHPAVAVYPRPDYRGNAELERLYALGIDAWRIAQALLAGQLDKGEFVLDGVTGKLTLGRDRHFVREPVVAQISGAAPQPVGPPDVLWPAPNAPPKP